jgi:hypothetical protein
MDVIRYVDGYGYSGMDTLWIWYTEILRIEHPPLKSVITVEKGLYFLPKHTVVVVV